MRLTLLTFLLASLTFVTNQLAAQEDTTGGDLMDLLETELEDKPQTEYTYATFKTTRIITSRSIELPAPGEMQFVISHRFGRVNSGWRDFFGLDQANMRFGFEYGATKWLSLGFGRSNVEKYYDGFVKLKFLRQSTGKRKMPITAVLFASVGITSQKYANPDRENYMSSRVAYAYQLMIARKFTPGFSMQVMPTMVHMNLVPTKQDKNDVFSIGAGARQMITKSLSINAEYFYVFEDQVTNPEMSNHIFSIGIDLETGGHVFQIMATNALGMVEQFYVPKTTGKWSAGDIHLGFNVNRMFSIADYEKIKKRRDQRKMKKQREQEEG